MNEGTEEEKNKDKKATMEEEKKGEEGLQREQEHKVKEWLVKRPVFTPLI